MQLLRIGGLFQGGEIVAIVRAGVTVRMPDNSFRSYDCNAVEKIMRQQYASRSPVKRVRGKSRKYQQSRVS
jgi:hypothetical protein